MPYILNVFFSCFLGKLFFITGKRYPKLLLEGHDFKVKHKVLNKTTWICCQYPLTKCRMRLVTTGQDVFLREEHNHPPLPKLKRCEALSYKIVNIIKK